MSDEEIKNLPTLTLLNMIYEANKNKNEWEKYRLELVKELERRRKGNFGRNNTK